MGGLGAGNAALRLLRSWPRTPPEGRPHVVDGIERFEVDGYDYSRLANIAADIVLIEWDLAVDPDDLAGFVDRARTQPDRVRVAPYRLYHQYPDEVWNDHRPAAVWAHRRVETRGVRWTVDSDDTCHFFGFGLAYLPRRLLAGYSLAMPLGDDSFSKWHYRNAPHPEVAIDWACRPVHLNHPPIQLGE